MTRLNTEAYEQIDGWRAIEVIATCGRRVYSESGDCWYRSGDTVMYLSPDGEVPFESKDHLNDFLGHQLYTEKTFDVRSVMRERPDEWVAAYYGDECGWTFKVGLSSKSMCAVTAPLEATGLVSDYEYSNAEKEELDRCFDIGVVPKEALESGGKRVGTILGMP